MLNNGKQCQKMTLKEAVFLDFFGTVKGTKNIYTHLFTISNRFGKVTYLLSGRVESEH